MTSACVVSPYCAEWPGVFRGIRDELIAVFSPFAVAVEHIGSTSVPGLAAKPVIDVLLGAHALTDIESRIGPLGELGYAYISKYEHELPMRRYFVKSPATSLRVHVHGVEIDSQIWREHLAFRDALRGEADLRSPYQALKLRLAEEFAGDKSAYTAAKGPFIRSALAAADEIRSAQGV
jgi:GrpB-like predicted nucleotidyltransferase (UPF0157 family)